METNSETLAVAINTGFRTKRGKIIRRILTRHFDEPQIFRSALIFIVEATIIGIITYGIYLILADAYGIEI